MHFFSFPFFFFIDLTGSADGSVRMWEWGHHQPLSLLRQPGCFSKVTKALFNAQGNKVSITFKTGTMLYTHTHSHCK